MVSSEEKQGLTLSLACMKSICPVSWECAGPDCVAWAEPYEPKLHIARIPEFSSKGYVGRACPRSAILAIPDGEQKTWSAEILQNLKQ